MERIRVLVVGSRLLRDIIEELTVAHDDIEVLADVPPPAAVEQVLGGTKPGVVVFNGDDAPGEPGVNALLYRHPLARVLVIEKARGDSFLSELRPYRRNLAELGPESLIAAIRDDAHALERA